MISSYFREIKYNMKVISQKAKCDQSDPGGHISENPAPYITRWELSCQIGYLYILKWNDGKINKIIKWHHENMITDGVMGSRHNENINKNKQPSEVFRQLLS